MTDMKGSTSADTDTRALHKEWDNTLCPICMDHPHNAVLLLCSSHDKGCRSYICDTSYRHSNCLDRFKKLRENSGDRPSHQPGPSSIEVPVGGNPGRRSLHNHSSEPFLRSLRRRTSEETNEVLNLEDISGGIPPTIPEPLEENNHHESDPHLESSVQTRMEIVPESTVSENSCLKCPLCRGTVKGWKIVKEARQYLDLKSRSCSRESCLFTGNYRELRRHARRLHPTTRPGDVDPSRQRAWRHLEHQHEYGDILSAIRSAMPGAIVLGDYVIDNGDGFPRDRDYSGEGTGQWLTTFFLFHMITNPLRSINDHGSGSSRTSRTQRRYHWGENLLGLQDDDDDDDDMNLENDQREGRRHRFIRFRRSEDRQP
ncbi:hypothetical protein QJS04_geneDACA002227 [Acorus gramineus]|uniref:Uncharacterized protein n=1 Tax=Acorus gramineus TaxID=55184 RepID=A0AAV9A9P3_ACOGR|nr:hypothetical protein QJS04_geneDACA002227 [Acorus gramineus]